MAPLESVPNEILCNILSRGFDLKQLMRIETVCKVLRKACKGVDKLTMITGCKTCDTSQAHSLLVPTLERDLMDRDFCQVREIRFEGLARLCGIDCMRLEAGSDIPANTASSLPFKLTPTVIRYVWSAEKHLKTLFYKDSYGQGLVPILEAASYCKSLQRLELTGQFTDGDDSEAAPRVSIPSLKILKLTSWDIPCGLLNAVLAGCENLEELHFFECSLDLECGGQPEAVVIALHHLRILEVTCLSKDFEVSLERADSLRVLTCLHDNLNFEPQEMPQFRVKCRLPRLVELHVENRSWRESETLLRRSPNLLNLTFIECFSDAIQPSGFTRLDVLLSRLCRSNPKLEELRTGLGTMSIPLPTNVQRPSHENLFVWSTTVEHTFKSTNAGGLLEYMLTACSSLEKLEVEVLVESSGVGDLSEWNDLMSSVLDLQRRFPDVELGVDIHKED